MLNTKKENKIKESLKKVNNTKKNCNIVMMKIRGTQKEENQEMMKEVL